MMGKHNTCTRCPSVLQSVFLFCFSYITLYRQNTILCVYDKNHVHVHNWSSQKSKRNSLLLCLKLITPYTEWAHRNILSKQNKQLDNCMKSHATFKNCVLAQMKCFALW